MTALASAARRLAEGGAVTLARAPEGFDAFVVADLTRALAKAGEARAVTLAFVARDSVRAQTFIDALGFAAPEIEALFLPSWDCQPYDRVSPNAAVSAERMTVLARLARTPRRGRAAAHPGRLGQRADPARPAAEIRRLRRLLRRARATASGWTTWRSGCETNGYARASTVREVGDYATRGGILDLYPPGAPAPIRLDFFGDTLESIRTFDPETQRSVGQLRSLDLVPMSEARLTTETIRRFRQAYAAEFGAPAPNDELYAAVSEGRRAIGLEHWLPLLYERPRHAVRLRRPGALRPRRAGRGGGEPAPRPDRRFLRRAARRLCPGPGARPTTSRCRPAKLYLTEDEWKERLAAAPARAAHPVRGGRRRGAMSSTAAVGSDAISRPSGRTRTPTCSTPPSRTSGICADAA